MSFFSPILAQEELVVSDAVGTWFSMNAETRYQLIMVGACVLLILALLIWAAFIRKTKKKRKRINAPHYWETEPGQRSKRRPGRSRKRLTEPSRNHTLAETGGLPPIRPRPPEPPGEPIA